jgi:hypothetical protein
VIANSIAPHPANVAAPSVSLKHLFSSHAWIEVTTSLAASLPVVARLFFVSLPSLALQMPSASAAKPCGLLPHIIAQQFIATPTPPRHSLKLVIERPQFRHEASKAVQYSA